MNENEIKELIENVNKKVTTTRQCGMIRRALKMSRFIPGTRKTLTPEVKKIIEDFVDKKEEEIKKQKKKIL